MPSPVLVLAPSLHSFWSYFSADLQSHIGHLPTWEVHVSASYLFSVHTVLGVLKAKILKWFAIPFSSSPSVQFSRSVVSDSLRPHKQQPSRLLHPWDFPGKSTGVGCHCLLCCSSSSSFIWLCFSKRPRRLISVHGIMGEKICQQIKRNLGQTIN